MQLVFFNAHYLFGILVWCVLANMDIKCICNYAFLSLQVVQIQWIEITGRVGIPKWYAHKCVDSSNKII